MKLASQAHSDWSGSRPRALAQTSRSLYMLGWAGGSARGGGLSGLSFAISLRHGIRAPARVK